MEMHRETYPVPCLCEFADYDSFLSSIQIHGPEKQTSIATLVISSFLRGFLFLKRTH